MYKKCTICYENNKKPSDKDCQSCDDELQRLKTENEKLEKDKKYRLEEIQNLNNKIKILTSITNITNKYKQALEEVREITKKYYLSDKKLLATGIEINPYDAIIEIQDKVNEVLNG